MRAAFPGGLTLAAHTERVTALPPASVPLARLYVVPVHQGAGAPPEVCVTVGTRVRRGDVLARAVDEWSTPVHAPTSGQVSAIAPHPVAHPGGLSAPCVMITSDGRDESVEPLPPLDWAAVAPATLIARVRACGIVGLGGAAFPTDVKLAVPVQPHTLILNGAECEPYIACDAALMQHRAADVVLGARIMLSASGAIRCVIAVEDDMPAAIAALEQALAAAADARLGLRVLPARYPEGGERQLVQALTGLEVPAGGLPLDLGLLVHNVGTAAAVADAVVRGQPLTERLVTVTGAGVAAPRNVVARIGTPLAELIAACGGYTPAATRLIMGGPMMGFALPADDVPVVKATNCVLVAGAAEVAAARPPLPCIRCGECATVCPAGLQPQLLHWHARAGELEPARSLGLPDCIECGCCDLACPSHIPLAAWFRHAKATLRAQDAERARSDHARERFDQRRARLERERAEREARLKAKQAALANRDGGGAP